MKIGVISAMTKEHEQLTRLGDVGGNTLILSQCGIGKVNAALGTAALIREHHPDCIISTGCAGGVEKGLEVMDVVVSTEVTYHDFSIPGCEPGQVQGLPARFRAEQELVETALALHTEGSTTIHGGLICTGDQFISDREQLDSIKAAFPEALAVDMESAAIAQTCFLMQTPFVSFRILSDTPGADQHLQQYLNFWDEMADRSFEITRRFLTALPQQFAVLRFAE